MSKFYLLIYRTVATHNPKNQKHTNCSRSKFPNMFFFKSSRPAARAVDIARGTGIPIVGNGDVRDLAHAAQLAAETGAEESK